jgi:hypothetical protein
MNQERVNFRLLENVHKVVLDHGDEIVNLRKEIKEVKSYFSFRMLMIYFAFILGQVIAVSFYIAHQESKIDMLIEKVQKK